MHFSVVRTTLIARVVSYLCLSREGVFAEPLSRAGGVGAGDWRPAQGGLPGVWLSKDR